MFHFKSSRSIQEALLVIVVTILMITGCSTEKASNNILQNGGARSMAVNVRVSEVRPSSLRETIRLLGETQANIDVTYSSEVAGRLEYLPVDYGDTVTRDQILARVDYEMLSAQAEQARAAYDLALKTFERLETLMKDDLVTQQKIDEARTSLIQAEAQLRQTEAALHRSVIKSTIDGIVARRFVEEGEYVMPGSPLVRVLDYSEIIVTAQIPENRVADIKSGSEVTVYIDALKETYSGVVDVVLPNADPESRTFSVRIRTPNKDRKILVGMAANLNIFVRQYEDVIVIPQDVVVEETEGKFVFVAEPDNTAKKILVSIGPSEKQSIIIESGLSTGDRLIVEGQRNLVDGQPINIVL